MVRKLRRLSCDDKSGMWLRYWRLYAPGAPEPQPEYLFAAHVTYTDKRGQERQRKYRFDWAYVEERVAVEIDGGVWLPHGGRHGLDTDRTKLNTAAMLRWLVFRFSPQQLEADPEDCIMMVLTALKDSV